MMIPDVEPSVGEREGARKLNGTWKNYMCMAVLGGACLAPLIPAQRERAKILLKYVDAIPATKLTSLLRGKLYDLFKEEGLIHLHGCVFGASIAGFSMAVCCTVRDHLIIRRDTQDVHNYFAGYAVGLATFGLLATKGRLPVRGFTAVKMMSAGPALAVASDWFDMVSGRRFESPPIKCSKFESPPKCS